MESGIPRKSDFEKDSYDAVAEIVSPDVVLDALKRIYGDVLEQPKFYGSKDRSAEERIAHQFAHVHQSVKKTAAEREGARKQQEQTASVEPDKPA
jgi:hypothetical protein